jgi:hypothetical protein
MKLKIVMLLLCAGAFYTLVAKNPIIPIKGAIADLKLKEKGQ